MLSRRLLFILIISSTLLTLGRSQDSAGEEDEDEYDEEAESSKSKTTETNFYKILPAATSSSRASDATRKPISEESDDDEVASAGVGTEIKRKQPVSEESDDEEGAEGTTRNPIMNPINRLMESVSKGNISGIVDNALSFRAPPGIREMVNSIMSTIFGFGEKLSNSVASSFSQTQQPQDTSSAQVAGAAAPGGLISVPVANYQQFQSQPQAVVGSSGGVVVNPGAVLPTLNQAKYSVRSKPKIISSEVKVF